MNLGEPGILGAPDQVLLREVHHRVARKRGFHPPLVLPDLGDEVTNGPGIETPRTRLARGESSY
jgi:hypothetical protein